MYGTQYYYNLLSACVLIITLVFSFSGIHLDFSPPTGKVKYEVLENAGSLEVCLTLANVGSYDSTVNLDTPVTVKLTAIETATKATTYPPGQ